MAGDLVSEGVTLLREGGRWVIAGALGGHTVGFDVRRLYLHNAQIIGSSMHTPSHFGLLMDIARQAQVRPVIAKAYPLHEASQAQEKLGRRRHVGKIVLHPQPLDPEETVAPERDLGSVAGGNITRHGGN
ncbi:zinc-binding dehydrogenase [Nesterenkonia haasae]|uniref:zinc-binding dehydrogenase n=1 Tax=Nesterenkonia haasae TaxID=2587813 RepID=UPI002E28B454|nr:zinc-binding dehydrogenase [Nesterenkonia haasae]